MDIVSSGWWHYVTNSRVRFLNPQYALTFKRETIKMEEKRRDECCTVILTDTLSKIHTNGKPSASMARFFARMSH